MHPTRKGVYEATYSNVTVYEVTSPNGVGVMRRKTDSWINATHILKAAGMEKSRRTKVLEREVHKGEHEKIQGGYGKYQGTWIPLYRAKTLAAQYGLSQTLHDILDIPE
ncbi:transcription regulator HTH, apses-type DNA-binding domain-containing protein [Gaertneriomyces semiglobifer]|nr:transcription regulator HTH, apses-type DNA-binding domain-containing protein [Gaertneriomyces semiglobifer]